MLPLRYLVHSMPDHKMNLYVVSKRDRDNGIGYRRSESRCGMRDASGLNVAESAGMSGLMLLLVVFDLLRLFFLGCIQSRVY